MPNLKMWTTIVSPLLQAWDKKWYDRLFPFWQKMTETFPDDFAKLGAIERDAWKSFQSGESAMIVRVKVSNYFNLLNKVSEKASNHESWRKAGSSG